MLRDLNPSLHHFVSAVCVTAMSQKSRHSRCVSLHDAHVEVHHEITIRTSLQRGWLIRAVVVTRFDFWVYISSAAGERKFQCLILMTRRVVATLYFSSTATP